jgi:Family of unknown function (DUF6069)
VSASRPTLMARLQSITRLDGRPLTHMPRTRRILAAGLISMAASLAADVLLVAVGTAAFHPPASFGPFVFLTYAKLTAAGIIGATAFWAGLVRVTSQPRLVLLRAAVAVTLLLLIPDVLLLPNESTGGVMTLMVMHVAIAIITTVTFLKVAPATGQARIAASANVSGKRGSAAPGAAQSAR